MQFCRKCNGRREFSPKSGTDNFSLINKADIGKIKIIKLNLSVAIEAGFVTSLRRDAFETQRHALGHVF
ncbi:hypothetical protein EAG21025_16520 [Enterobacter asburiae]